MKNVLIYNDFIGSVDFSADDEVFFGKIESSDFYSEVVFITSGNLIHMDVFSGILR